MLEVKMDVSTIIGGEDEGHVIHTGTLLDVLVREATPDEIAASIATEASEDNGDAEF
jgi:hypothetical protein